MSPIRVLSKDNIRPRRHSLGSEACPRHSIMQPKQTLKRLPLLVLPQTVYRWGEGGVFASTKDSKYNLCFYYGLWSKSGLTTVDPEPGNRESRGPARRSCDTHSLMWCGDGRKTWHETTLHRRKYPPLSGPARPADRWRGLKTHGATKQLLMEFEN